MAYFTLPALAGWVVRDWMPDILREQFGLGEGRAGVSAVLYVQLASLVGVGLGGWLADRWMKRTIRGPALASALGVSFFMPSLFGVGGAETVEVAIGFLILFGLGWGFFDCNNMPILCQIVRPELRATGYGIMNLVSIACGGFADWGFGRTARCARLAHADVWHFRCRRVIVDRAGADDSTERTSSCVDTRNRRIEMTRPCLWFLLLLGAIAAPAVANEPGLVSAEFVFDSAPFASCHASTIVETTSGTARDGLLRGPARRE